MPQILVDNLEKRFRVAARDPGMWGAVRGLVRRRHRLVRALEGVSFSIEAGELVGYIGPNGAGKSTTIKVLAGILPPRAGVCCQGPRAVEGARRPRRAHRRGLRAATQLWWDLPVIESFDLLATSIASTPHPSPHARRAHRAAQSPALLDVPVRQLSLGQRMRCDSPRRSCTRRHPVPDEPTIGLDAVSKLAVRDFIRRLNGERGVTVILTTHDMDDIEALPSG